MKRLKVYKMVGLPGETDDDIDELVRFTRELSRILPVALGVAPFVAKRNTPLDGAPFAGIDVVERRLDAAARAGCAARSRCARPRARWAWVEYMLAQGGLRGGPRPPRQAARAGGSFAAWKGAFADVPAPAASNSADVAHLAQADVQSTVAIASISTRAPLGRPAA